MECIVLSVILWSNCFIIQVISWDIKKEYYEADYDKNKKCDDEERVKVLKSFKNQQNEEQCFSQPWGKGSQMWTTMNVYRVKILLKVSKAHDY